MIIIVMSKQADKQDTRVFSKELDSQKEDRLLDEEDPQESKAEIELKTDAEFKNQVLPGLVDTLHSLIMANEGYLMDPQLKAAITTSQSSHI